MPSSSCILCGYSLIRPALPISSLGGYWVPHIHSRVKRSHAELWQQHPSTVAHPLGHPWERGARELLPGSCVCLLPKSGSCLPLGARQEDETHSSLAEEALNLCESPFSIEPASEVKSVWACRGCNVIQSMCQWKVWVKSFLLFKFFGRN